MTSNSTDSPLDNLTELPIDFFSDSFNREKQSFDILSIGDAWFNYPMNLKDINDYLSLSYRICHVDIFRTYAGDRLFSDLDKKLNNLPSAKIVILSYGFYDFAQLFNSPPTNDEPFSFMSPDESQKIIQKLQELNEKEIPVIFHGYDYFIPGKSDWLSKILYDRNCNDVVDSFNSILEQNIIPMFSNFHYLDLRGTLTQEDWYDELYPNDEGFRKLSEKFKDKIEELLNPDLTNKKRILWVDDNPGNNTLLVNDFRKNNIAITEVLDTASALKLLQKNLYDIIISDIGRGKEREAGIDLLRRVKELDISTPFIFYTTKNYVARYEKEVLALGAFAIKTNPQNIKSTVLEVLEGDQSFPFKHKWVLIAGTAGSEISLEERLMAESLGRNLAKKGYGIVLGIWRGVDEVLGNAYINFLRGTQQKISNRCIEIIEEEWLKDVQAYGKSMIALNFLHWKEIAFWHADAFIIIGGREGTFNIFESAFKKNIPVIPIQTTGGTANQVYNHLVQLNNSTINKSLLKDIKIVDDEAADDVSEEIVQILDKLSTFKKKKLSKTAFTKIAESIYSALPIKEKDDLQKYRWGGKSESNGKRIAVEVKETLIPKLYKVKLSAVDANKKCGFVAFSLHNTFIDDIRVVRFKDGVATVTLNQVYESFTLGGYFEDGTVLELDLNNLPGFPNGFYHQDISEYFKNEVRKIFSEKEILNTKDIQQGRWGGQKESDNFVLNAKVERRVNLKNYIISIELLSRDNNNPVSGDVAFFVNDSDANSIKYKKIMSGRFFFQITASKAFTIGAYTENGEMLELNLQNEKGYPDGFYHG